MIYSSAISYSEPLTLELSSLTSFIVLKVWSNLSSIEVSRVNWCHMGWFLKYQSDWKSYSSNSLKSFRRELTVESSSTSDCSYNHQRNLFTYSDDLYGLSDFPYVLTCQHLWPTSMLSQSLEHAKNKKMCVPSSSPSEPPSEPSSELDPPSSSLSSSSPKQRPHNFIKFCHPRVDPLKSTLRRWVT